MRIMAVDLGDVRTGYALSDPTGMIPGETGVITDRVQERLADTLWNAARERGVTCIVVGCPINMNGTRGPRADKADDFAGMLRSRIAGDGAAVEVVMWDERGTSVSANRMLSDAGKKKGRQRAMVDAVAASIILQGYLDFLRATPGTGRSF